MRKQQHLKIMFQMIGIFSCLRKYLILSLERVDSRDQDVLHRESKNNCLFKVCKGQFAVPENCEYIKVSLLNDNILKKRNLLNYLKEMIIFMQVYSNI